jgi:hypothetical protein
MPCPTTV